MIRALIAAALAAAAPAAASAQEAMAEMPGMSQGPMRWMGEGAYGAYAMTREASGTAWQPEASTHEGWHVMRGPWMIMLHGELNGVLDRQRGPRGDDKAFVSGMFMASAKRTLSPDDTLQLRAMLSPEPFMGKSGYPLLLATGETANGVAPLVDRQHPHDLVMELSASFAHRLTPRDSVFIYAALPGEPAFGPPAFMHRLSIMDSPAAPISHHWLDSTHITFGVLTAGYVHGDWKVEASRFRGREPNEHRYDIETGPLDSTSARLSWNPTRNWSLQASWAEVKSPEELEPAANQRKWSASAIYTVPVGEVGWWSTTAAWGRRSSGHGDLDAWVMESAVRPTGPWTLYGRAERVENDELLVGRGAAYTVGKLSVGAVHDWRVSEHVQFGLGAEYGWNLVPGALKPLYGSDPEGVFGFARLKLQ